MGSREVFGGATCKSCGLVIRFYKAASGKVTPCNPDGSDHWDRCSQRRLALARDAADGKITRIDRGEGAWEEGYVNPRTGEFTKLRSSARTTKRRDFKMAAAGEDDGKF